jgi:two-component system, OmpR family, sensor kinase
MRSLSETATAGIDFQSVAAHDLRSPLAAVIIQLEILAGRLEGEDAELATGALHSARRMGRLVDQLLAVSGVDGAETRAHVPVDLGEVAMDVVDELECMTGDHLVSITSERAVVSGVHDDLDRLILNLVDNALVHTPGGTEIDVTVAASETSATVIVRDNGPGIPAELESRVFERFVRGPDDGSGGLGLGLAIVRDLAQAHGRTVTPERPRDPRGTRFVVTLPPFKPRARAEERPSRLRLVS